MRIRMERLPRMKAVGVFVLMMTLNQISFSSAQVSTGVCRNYYIFQTFFPNCEIRCIFSLRVDINIFSRINGEGKSQICTGLELFISPV